MLVSSILSTYTVTVSNNRKASKNSYRLKGFDGFALKTPGCFDYKCAKPNMKSIITKNAEAVTQRPLSAKDLDRSHDYVGNEMDKVVM